MATITSRMKVRLYCGKSFSPAWTDALSLLSNKTQQGQAGLQDLGEGTYVLFAVLFPVLSGPVWEPSKMSVRWMNLWTNEPYFSYPKYGK